jgi:hypothetical protein
VISVDAEMLGDPDEEELSLEDGLQVCILAIPRPLQHGHEIGAVELAGQ